MGPFVYRPYNMGHIAIKPLEYIIKPISYRLYDIGYIIKAYM